MLVTEECIKQKIIQRQNIDPYFALSRFGEHKLFYIDPVSKEKVVAYRIADNRVAMDAQWDFPILKQEIGDLLDMNFDIDLLGFDDKELARLIEGVDADLKDLSDSVDTVYEVVVECANEGEQEKVFKKIEELFREIL